ncbi:MAG: serine/threonine protein kinase [Massilia sp.]
MKTPRQIGPYLLLSALGEPARGNVWLATAGAQGEKLVLKIASDSDLDGRARLLYEVDIAMQFDHPNIMRIYECGAANEFTWISMAYVGGSHGTVTFANFRQLLLAMVHIHANDVVHADIRYGNLLIDEFGNLRLAGFGLARRQGDTSGVVPAPSRSPSPEQLRGQAIDTRTDIFAAGVVLFQVLTGKPPFEGSALEIMRQIANERQVLPSEAAPGLGTSFDEVVQKALAREKDERFGTAFEFLSAFDAACKRGLRPTR